MVSALQHRDRGLQLRDQNDQRDGGPLPVGSSSLAGWCSATCRSGPPSPRPQAPGSRASAFVNDSSFYNVQCSGLEQLRFGALNRLWNGFDFSLGVGRVYIDPACFIIAKNNGITAASGAELYLDGRILFCTVGCLLGGSIGGVYFNGEISQCGTGVLCNTSLTGATNREIFFEERAIIDSCKDYGVHILPAQSRSSTCPARGSPAPARSPQARASACSSRLRHRRPTAIAKISGARFYNNLVTGWSTPAWAAWCQAAWSTATPGGIILETAGANGSMIDSCRSWATRHGGDAPERHHRLRA